MKTEPSSMRDDPAAASQAPRRRWPRRLVQAGVLVALLALAWTAAVGWWLPRWLQPRLEAAATQALGAPLTVEQLSVEPWTLRAQARGLRLGPAQAPWLSVPEIELRVAAASLWRLAPVLSALSVRGAQVHVERLAPGRYNISPLIDALAQPSAAPAAEPLRFAVHGLRLEGGELRYVDRVGGPEHRATAVQLEIPLLSNLPSDDGAAVEPLLQAQVDGSRLSLRGSGQVFTEHKRGTAELRWQGLDLARAHATLAALLPPGWPLAVQSGALDLALQLDYAHRAAPAAPRLGITGSLAASGLQASLPDRGLKLAAGRVALAGLDLAPLEGRARVGTVTLQAPEVDADLPRLAASPAGAVATASPAPPAASAAGSRWQWHIERAVVEDGRLKLRGPGWPEGQTLAPVQATVAGLGSGGGPPAALSLSFADSRGAQARLEGSLDLAAMRLQAQVELDGVQPVPWLTPWSSGWPVRLQQGRLSLKARTAVDAGGWVVDDGSLQVDGLQLAPGRAPRGPPADRLSVARVVAGGVQLRATDGQPLSAEVGSVRVDRLDLRATRKAGGALPWLPSSSAVRSRAAPRSAGRPAPATKAASWQLGELRCRGCALRFTDEATQPAVTLGLTRTDLVLRRLRSDMARPFDFELGTAVGTGGRVQARGSLRLQPLALRSRLDLDKVDLAPLQSYLDPYVNLTLEAAHAGANGELRVDGTAREPVASVRWQGRMALTDLRALDRLNAAEFLRLRSLSLTGADLAWQPAGVVADLGLVALDGFYGRVIINADGRINLRDILKRDGSAGAVSLTTPTAPEAAASAPAPMPPPAPDAAAAPAAATAPTPLRWRSIQLSDGEVDFTDNFIRPNYSARLTGIQGEISALAWDDPQPAEVRVKGEVDDSAPLEITGTLHPLGARLHTDIRAQARGIDMTRLSAYAARYAGYGIEKGTLTARVRYRIDDGRLQAENQLVLDQLTFGDKVDSPDALKLPVLLAVALLKDSNGVIDVNLPIGGSLDDPQFSIGGLVVRMIVNLIVKAVTAPFALLAQAFGGGGQELSFVAFEAGSAAIAETMKPALDTIAKALAGRPALHLEITGRADPAQDVPALRHAHLERLLREAKARATRSAAAQVEIGADERARWLEAAYRAADIPGKPRNLLGLQRTLPAAEMEALLLQGAQVGEPQLKALADARAGHVKAYLSETVAAERLLLTASRPDAADIADGGSAARVAFALK